MAFDSLRDKVLDPLKRRTAEILDQVVPVLTAAREVDRRLDDLREPVAEAVATDVAAQREALVYDGFVSGVGPFRIADLARYLNAILMRLEQQPHTPARDRQRMESVHRVQARYNDLLDTLPASRDEDVLEIAWMIEELRVSLFAQSLGTPGPISEKRVLDAIAAATL